jgi:hypothetical protein
MGVSHRLLSTQQESGRISGGKETVLAVKN